MKARLILLLLASSCLAACKKDSSQTLANEAIIGKWTFLKLEQRINGNPPTTIYGQDGAFYEFKKDGIVLIYGTPTDWQLSNSNKQLYINNGSVKNYIVTKLDKNYLEYYWAGTDENGSIELSYFFER